MTTRLLALIILGAALAGCAPSLDYRLGQGFYADNLAHVQVQAAANSGRVKHLGRFSGEAGNCGLYSQDIVDREIVVPTIKDQLRQRGANAADKVVVNEQSYDFLLGLLVVPALMGCSNWVISGEALLVEPIAEPISTR